MSNSLSSSSNFSSGHSKDLFIYEIPPKDRRLLCEHLDELNEWMQLAEIMSLKPADVQTVRRKHALGSSATDELLKIWGGQYNHTVTELFFVLKKRKLHQAMRLLKDFVDHKFHMFIPKSQPVLSVLMAHDKSNGNEHTQKILNCSTSSGVSNSNNVSTSDNSSINYTSTSQKTSDGSKYRSNYLSESNVKEYASYILEINYDELTKATNNWCNSFILGKGGFGTVYRGNWKYTDVAIKQIHYRGPNGKESIKVQIQQSLNELKYLNSCRHDNVLPLYGYSIKGEKPCLVYQLMHGGSLEQRLSTRNPVPLTWQQRIKICMGTARGINYIHTFRDKPLIHGDIKPANVLLDQCLWPKIGDFGLAREGPHSVNCEVEVTQVFGTKPYLPPEFLNLRKLSTQVDTYSFGVVLLETFTGLRVYDKNRAHPLLTKYIRKLCERPDYNVAELIDKRVPLLPGEEDLCLNTIQLGLKCIAENPQDRPQMEQVLNAINCYYNF